MMRGGPSGGVGGHSDMSNVKSVDKVKQPVYFAGAMSMDI